jgi:methionine-rich copper-binding protein CopC
MSNPARVLAIAAIVGLALTGQTLAHAHLLSAAPPVNGAVATSPTELDLKFSEDLYLKFSGVRLTGPGKAPVQAGEATRMGGDATLMVPLSGMLAPGVYTVDWHALSADGHKAVGSYTFTVNR